MALSPLSAPTSPLPRQLLRYVSSCLGVALDRRAPPTISLPSAPRGLDVAASQRLRAAPSPKGRPGAPRQGSGGHVHAAAAPAMATIAARVATPMRRPTPPGAPAQGSGGKIHAAAAAAAAARVVMRGPAPPGPPAQGSGGRVHAVSPPAVVKASVLMRRPAPPGPPAEGAGGRGGIIHAVAS